MIKEKNKIPKAPVERLMKGIARKYEVTRVSKGATNEMVDSIEDIAIEIMESAVRLAKHAGRNTVTSDDIKMAIK